MARGDGRRGARPGAGRAPASAVARRRRGRRGARSRCSAPLGSGRWRPRCSRSGAPGGHLRLAALDAPAGRVRDGAPGRAAGGAASRRRGRAGSDPRPRPSVSSGRLRGARLLLRAPAWSPFPRGAARRRGAGARGRLGALAAEGRSDFDDHLRRRGRGRRAGARAGARHRPPARRARRGARRHAPCGPSGRSGPGWRRAEAALLRGMVLGQDEAIDPVTREDFRASGLAHLLAVSGQNVMLLVALALPAAAARGRRRRAARLAVLAGADRDLRAARGRRAVAAAGRA